MARMMNEQQIVYVKPTGWQQKEQRKQNETKNTKTKTNKTHLND